MRQEVKQEPKGSCKTKSNKLTELTKESNVMRHYVAMVRDELGDEQRATQEVYEYPDFDEENETACRLFNAWRAELENIIQEEMPDEFGSVWIERVHSEQFRYCSIW